MPFKNEEEEHADLEVMSQDILNLEIRSFTNLKKKPTQDYLKPHSFEMCIKDSDDVCQYAVMLIKKLMGSEEA